MALNKLTADTLIDQYIDPNPWGRGRYDAMLKEAGVSVWILVNRLNTGTSVRDLAAEYDLTEEAVEAAQAFYEQSERNRRIIDAWILINEAAFEE